MGEPIYALILPSSVTSSLLESTIWGWPESSQD